MSGHDPAPPSDILDSALILAAEQSDTRATPVRRRPGPLINGAAAIRIAVFAELIVLIGVAACAVLIGRW